DARSGQATNRASGKGDAAGRLKIRGGTASMGGESWLAETERAIVTDMPHFSQHFREIDLHWLPRTTRPGPRKHGSATSVKFSRP
ncbi:MAG: hypothetical protein WBD10_10860, partial [Acidobacteriaceae bacterium]